MLTAVSNTVANLNISSQPQPRTTSLMPQKEVRTRFAPSPTGFLHIGGLRTALYSYLMARHFGGKFILRIEDTDRTRLVKGSVTDIMEMLKWAGMEPDEYPVFDINEKYVKDEGSFGPYVQSARLDLYRKYVNELLETGSAYRCFCSQERLEKMRADQTAKKIPTHYDKTCRDLRQEDIAERLKNGLPYVVRFKSPMSGETVFNDLVRGTVRFKNSLVDDYILLKSDGFPTYHLANVVDDHLMEITHIVRGEEWLSSAPIHKLLYQAFGWDTPAFAHPPNILGTDKKKLSKRTGDVAVNLYRDKGYLPEALLNFILLLGWNPGTDKEIFTKEEMIREFGLEQIGRSGAIFDLQKLDWMNGHYIRSMSLDVLAARCIPDLVRAGLIENTSGSKFKVVKTGEEIDLEWLKKVVALEQQRIKKLSELPEVVKFVFEDMPDYDKKLLKWKKSEEKDTINSLALSKEKIDAIPEDKFDKGTLQQSLEEITKKIGVGETLWPFRAALTGLKASAGPYEVAEVLGKKKVLARLDFALKKIKAD